MSAHEPPELPDGDTEPEPAAADEQAPAKPFLVVGVGASAGGLEAFKELLADMPPDPGLAFLYVQHLDPKSKSLLPDIIRPVSRLTVHEVTEGVHVEPNHVYLIPPNTTMTLADGRLMLAPRPQARTPHMPIDHLFRSLADIQRSRAVGVVLSGTGTDGTLGFQAIKAEGGINFAQDEQLARFDSMPRSANDLVNLLAAVNIPTVLVSRDLRVSRFTPLAEQLLNLIPTDVGRPISDIKPNFDLPNFPDLIARVIDTLTPLQCELQDRQGHWYSLRIRPYVTLENKIDGASIALLDIDSIRRGVGDGEDPGPGA